jgi:hypothetical protein
MGTRLHFEKLVLRLLCVGTTQGPAADTLSPLLRDYQWKSTLHRAIYNAIAAFPSDDPEALRQWLPAKLTRMGFPDVEWEEIFAPASLSREEAIAIVRQLLAGA